MRTPKLHFGDTGTASALPGVAAAGLADLLGPDRALFGPLLETFIDQELRRQTGDQEPPVRRFRFRDKDAVAVGPVLEQGADGQAALGRINARLPGLTLVLPTAAQREHASQAGTDTTLYTGPAGRAGSLGCRGARGQVA